MAKDRFALSDWNGAQPETTHRRERSLQAGGPLPAYHGHRFRHVIPVELIQPFDALGHAEKVVQPIGQFGPDPCPGPVGYVSVLEIDVQNARIAERRNHVCRVFGLREMGMNGGCGSSQNVPSLWKLAR